MARGAATPADDILFGSSGPRNVFSSAQARAADQLQYELLLTYSSLTRTEQRILKAALLLSIKNRDGCMTIKQLQGKVNTSTTQLLINQTMIETGLGHLVEVGWLQAVDENTWSLTDGGALARDTEQQGIEAL